MIHLVGAWHCLDCDARGEGEPKMVERQATKHTKDTSHNTVTEHTP